MKRATILLLLSGCAPACEDAPLEALGGAPAFVVELSTEGSLVPGGAVDAGARAERTALVLYDAEGMVLSDRWLDTTTRWEGARGTFDADDALPWHQAPGHVTLTIDSPPSVATLDATGGEVARSVALPIGGAPVDFVTVSETVGVLSREDGLAIVEPMTGAVVRTIDLEALAGPRTQPARVAPFAGTELVAVGLVRPPEEGGAVAIVDTSGGAARLLELPGLRSCAAVSAVANEPGEPAQVAVLCAGELDRDPDARREAGVVLLEVEEGARVAATQTGLSPAPTEALVGAIDGWVVALSRGSMDRPDVLLAVNLETGARATLRQEVWSPRDGPALGEGAFNPITRELWWPSVELGVARFELEGGAFAALSPVRAPLCQRAPARRVRHLP